MFCCSGSYKSPDLVPHEGTEGLSRRQGEPMRLAGGIAGAGSDGRFAQELDRAVRTGPKDALLPGSDHAAHLGDPCLDDHLVVGHSGSAVLHGEVGHDDLGPELSKRRQRATDIRHRLTTAGLEPPNVNRVIDVVVRVEFAEPDLQSHSMRGHRPRDYAGGDYAGGDYAGGDYAGGAAPAGLRGRAAGQATERSWRFAELARSEHGRAGVDGPVQ